VGRGGTLVDSMPLDRNVVGSNPILAATPGTLGKSFGIIYCVYCIRLPVALRRVNSDTVNYCGRERLWVVVDSKRRYRNIRIEWMNIISPFVCGRCDNGGACFYVWIHACMHECMYIFVIGVDLSKILGGARSGQSAMTDDIIGASGAT